MRVAFLTCRDIAQGHPDDQRVQPFAEELGLRVDFVPWREDADWRGYDAVVIRTPWDYQHDPDAFLGLLDQIESMGTPVWNPSAMVRWNFEKGYLATLRARGQPVIPSTFTTVTSREELEAVVEAIPGESVVVKPRVGASGEDTWRLWPSGKGGRDEDWAAAADALVERELVAQPFLPRILDEGEYSQIVVGGKPSHLVCKRPRGNEFRSQEELGGEVFAIEDPSYTEWAMDLLAATPEASGALYARVDAIRGDEGWLLGELELIEPQLYFGCVEGSARVLAQALFERLQGRVGNE